MYLAAFGLELFATFTPPTGSPRWEAQRWELGTGWRFHVGPLVVDVGRSYPG